jgi:predicted dienelactone hydrolase
MARFCALVVAATILLLWLPGTGSAGDAWHAGFRDVVYVDEARGRTIPVAVWYPTEMPAGTIIYGQIHEGWATADAAIAPGRHPLLLLSHGTGGNRLNQYNLGEYLARAGYVVAAVEHPGDRTFDRGDFGTAKNLYNRPRDLSVVLDALLADSAVAPAVDPARIGALGHSAGGFAVVVAVGGLPNVANLLAYCRDHAEDTLTCPEESGARPDEAPEYIAYIEGGVSLKDSRIKVGAVFAPAIGPFFDEIGLAPIDIPIAVFSAGMDEILDEPTNSAFYLQGIQGAIAHEMTIGHFGFLSLCSDLLQSVAPQICGDPPGVSRAAFHQVFQAKLGAFLDERLRPREE